MAKFIEYLKRIKPVYRRSSNRMKIIVTVAIVLAIIGLFAIRCSLAGLQADNQVLENQAAMLEQENDDLEHSISIQGSKESVIQIARELLGLVMPNTIIVQPEG